MAREKTILYRAAAMAAIMAILVGFANDSN
jgi:hypothetical protein